MVRKQSKGGLNTGNTLRCYSLVARVHKRGFCMVSKSAKNAETTDDPIESEMNTCFPYKHTSDNLEYSLDKKGRWTIPEMIRTALENSEEDRPIECTLMEHPLQLGRSMNFNEIKSYHSNTNGYVSKVCRGYTMDLNSAKHVHKQEDHYTRKQRNQQKKLKKVNEPEAPEVVKEKPAITCHVAYTPDIAGKHCKDFSSPYWKDNKTTRTGTKLNRQYGYGYLIEDEWSEEELEGYCYESEAADSKHTVLPERAIQLVDLLHSCTNKRRIRHNRKNSTLSLSSLSSSSSASSNTSSLSRDKIFYIDTPAHQVATSVPKQLQQDNLVDLSWNKDFLNLHLNDYSSEHLIEALGDDFMESFCTPRIFSIKLNEPSGTSYLIFMEKQLEKHMYKVFLSGAQEPSTLYSYLIESVDTSESHSPLILAAILTQKLSSQATTVSSPLFKPGYNLRSPSLLQRWDVTATSIEKITPRIIKKYGEEQSLNLRNKQKAEDDFVFIPRYCQRSVSCMTNCGICFETSDETLPHCALLPCQHYICVDCWSGYLVTNIKQGSVHLKCPQFECEKSVDPVFVRAFVDFRTYKLYESMLAEHLVLKTGQGCWCPKEKCENVLLNEQTLAAKAEPVEATCRCGNRCCIRCQGEPHWPVSCKDYQLYKSLLLKAGLFVIKMDVSSTVTVRHKSCPTCNFPIEKDGGCEHMTCIKCKTAFCWKCCQPYVGTQYYHKCEEKEAKLNEHTFTHSLSDGSNNYLNSACRHRLARSALNFNKFKREVLSLVSTLSRKRCVQFMDDHSCTSIKDLFNQIVQLCNDCHRLLEFCNALNGYRKQTKIAAAAISQLEFLLWNLESNLNKNGDLYKVYELYKQANDCAQNVVNSVSRNLSYD